MPTQRDLGSMRKKDTYSKAKKQVLFLILLFAMSKQFHKHKKFIINEKFGTVYFSLTCLY
jgi:hypothetical protein